MDPLNALTRALGLGALPLAAALGLGVLAAHPPAPEQLSAAPLPAACPRPPVFTPGYQRGENYVTPRGAGFHFGSEAWVEATVCSAGTLEITAQGELGGDEKPRLTVVLNETLLAAPAFGQERTVRLRLPGAGRVFLGYFNDFYDTEARVVSLREFKLFGPGCQELQTLQFDPGKGVNLDPAGHTASLASGLPVTFTPCRGGELQLRLLGRAGHGAAPVLKITQGPQVLYRQPVGAPWHLLRLKVQRRPITLQLTNPYWKTVADRNLNVRQITFIPDPAR